MYPNGTLFSAARTYNALELNPRSTLLGPQGSVIPSTFYMSHKCAQRLCLEGTRRLERDAVSLGKPSSSWSRSPKAAWSWTLRNVGNHSPNDTASHPINLNFSNTAVRNWSEICTDSLLALLVQLFFCAGTLHTHTIFSVFLGKNAKFSVRHIVYFLSEVRATCFGLIN